MSGISTAATLFLSIYVCRHHDCFLLLLINFASVGYSNKSKKNREKYREAQFKGKGKPVFSQ